MDIASAFSALSAALNYGSQLSFIVYFQFLIALLRPDIVDEEHRVKIIKPQDINNQSYDFIIIGAGTAGSVIANRLTENPEWTVLLLEAGGEEPLIADVPAMQWVLEKTQYDWEFKTEPSNKSCLGMNNQQCLYPRGKGLGGSSMDNSLLYVRGNRKDYDKWRDLGNPGWGYDDVLPYFKKSEDISIPELEDSPYHGKGGYLGVDHYKYNHSLTDYFLGSVQDLGYEVVDVNGKSQNGFFLSQGTLRNGLRCSTAKAFLRSVSNRMNLYISTESMVVKILINEFTRTAYGVEFTRGGEKFVVSARNEVILSAGAVQSPQILMLSGIGPRKHLEKFGIPLKHDSPGVGQNLMDHVGLYWLGFLIDLPSESPVTTVTTAIGASLMTGSNIVTMVDAEQFLNGSSESRLFRAGIPVQGWVNTKYNHDLDVPDLHMQFMTGINTVGGSFISEEYFGVKDDIMASLNKDIMGNSSYGIIPLVAHPKSRGYIELKDTNPNSHPAIVPNYLEDPYDLDILVEGVKLAHKISETPTWKSLNSRPNPNLIPDCVHLKHPSDAYWRCHIRHMTMIGYHFCGTCKMGPANDTMAVVDSRLRVHCVNGLRVIDASIMPIIPGGNTNAPTIMIAERAADFIKEDYERGARPTEQFFVGCRLPFSSSSAGSGIGSGWRVVAISFLVLSCVFTI